VGGDVPHPAPFRQVVCVLEGTLEVEASDGNPRRLDPGQRDACGEQVGRGHGTRAVTDDALVVTARLVG
jgi:quercetin dioxygenase-like cupin family protein